MKLFINQINRVYKNLQEDTDESDIDTPESTDIGLTDEDIAIIERTRQALLINRDEIDIDEARLVFSPVTRDTALMVNDVISSILDKSISNTSEIKPSGHY